MQNRASTRGENSLQMQATGMRHVMDSFRDAEVDTTFAEGLRAVFDRTVADGRGADGLSSLFETAKKG